MVPLAVMGKRGKGSFCRQGGEMRPILDMFELRRPRNTPVKVSLGLYALWEIQRDGGGAVGTRAGQTWVLKSWLWLLSDLRVVGQPQYLQLNFTHLQNRVLWPTSQII